MRFYTPLLRSSDTWRMVLATILLTSPFQAGGVAPSPAPQIKDADKDAAKGHAMEVRFVDGCLMKLWLLEERLPLSTPYGKLLIPVGEIHEMEFATRTADDVAVKVHRAIRDLGSSEFKRREVASATLARLQVKAYPLLLKQEKNKDAEVQRRVNRLLEMIRKTVPEENLQPRLRDVVVTEHSKIAGRLETPSLKAETAQFGEVQVRLSDVCSIRSLSHTAHEPQENALPDPGNLTFYQQRVGQTFSFQVTGAQVGNVWGTDFYTLDSSLAAAAVHAGMLRAGQKGVVKVTITGPRNGFTGSMRNGVNSIAFLNYPGAFEFVKKR